MGAELFEGVQGNLFCMTRAFTLSKSSTLFTGFLLLVRLQKPFS